jgi:hypothetical protein
MQRTKHTPDLGADDASADLCECDTWSAGQRRVARGPCCQLAEQRTTTRSERLKTRSPILQ